MPVTVNWLEAKMFYGASSIPEDGKSACGKLVSIAEKYVKHYGPGMMVFSYGCGKELAHQLNNKGVLVMDASPLDLSDMKGFLKTWCADSKGRILA